ncbi:MAG: peptidase M15 [Prevotella sp.]|nr:peptidase M15 [Prevotella sp.]MBQ5971351.1 peptidase M15 [Prevotella sp.]MBR1519420.1 peptidase M15 [Prevotella sp.]
MKTTDIRLTEHFSLSEFTRSATADRHGIDNTPDTWQVTNLHNLCCEILEPLRRRFGPIHISSGFRTEQLNALVGGVGNSQHMLGEAADIRIPDEKTGHDYYQFIRTRCNYDQLLLEHNRWGATWLHVSCRNEIARNRHMAFYTPKARK